MYNTETCMDNRILAILNKTISNRQDNIREWTRINENRIQAKLTFK